MGQGITLFQQLQGRLPWRALDDAVVALGGDYKVHRATCRSHFLVLLTSLLLRRCSLRDMERGLSGRQVYLRHFGLGSIDHNTVSHANRHRPAEAVEAVFAALLRSAQGAAPVPPGPWPGRRYTLDATEIRVSSTLFEWARCTPQKSGIKLHVFLDHQGLLPVLIEFATLRESELKLARRREYLAGTLLCFDQGYFDTVWFRQLTAQGVTFVTRLPPRPQYAVVEDRPVDVGSNVLDDQTIRFISPVCRKQYRGELRLITVYDPVGDRVLQFLTNQMTWEAAVIAQIYKDRWQIELFFKWLKQNLKVTHLLGRTENAVRWQILVALCVYLLLALLKFENHLALSLRDLHGCFGLYLFDRVTMHDLWNQQYQFQT